jgi:hypothetical protein
MPYTADQLSRFNTKPGDIAHFTTVTISNSVAGEKRFMIAGRNGPYNPRSFLTDGVYHEYQPVFGVSPEALNQEPDSNTLGNITIARIGTDFDDYIDAIRANVSKTEDKIINIRVATYNSVATEAINYYNVYAGIDGVRRNQSAITIPLQYENPAKIRLTYYYDAEVFDGLANG